MASQSASSASIWSLFKVPAFPRFFCLLVPAAIAVWIDFIAVMVLVSYTWELGPVALSSVVMASTFPRVVFGLPAGVLVDRMGAGRVLVISLSGQMLAMICLFFFATNLEILIALVLIKSTFATALIPAEQLALKKIVPPELMTQAVSVSHFVIQSTKVFAPVLGGVLLAVLSVHQVFLLGAFMFGVTLLVALTLLTILARDPQSAEDEEVSSKVYGLFEDVKEGLVFVLKQPHLLLAVTLITISFFAIFMYEAFILLIVKETGQPESAVGLILGSLGVGGLAGTYVTSRIGDRFEKLHIMCFSMLGSSVLTTMIGYMPLAEDPISREAQMFLWFLLGTISTLGFISYGALLLKYTPESLMGRVSSLSEVTQSAVTLLAIPFGAFLASQWYVSMPFFVASAVTLSGSVIGVIGVLALAKRGTSPSERSSSLP